MMNVMPMQNNKYNQILIHGWLYLKVFELFKLSESILQAYAEVITSRKLGTLLPPKFS